MAKLIRNAERSNILSAFPRVLVFGVMWTWKTVQERVLCDGGGRYGEKTSVEAFSQRQVFPSGEDGRGTRMPFEGMPSRLDH